MVVSKIFVNILAHPGFNNELINFQLQPDSHISPVLLTELVREALRLAEIQDPDSVICLRDIYNMQPRITVFRKIVMVLTVCWRKCVLESEFGYFLRFWSEIFGEIFHFSPRMSENDQFSVKKAPKSGVNDCRSRFIGCSTSDSQNRRLKHNFQRTVRISLCTSWKRLVT